MRTALSSWCALTTKACFAWRWSAAFARGRPRRLSGSVSARLSKPACVRFDCSFSTWLYRIVSNLCLDQLRKRKVRKEEPASLATSEGQLDRFEFVAEDRADVDPQRRLMSAQINSRISEVLTSLTARERMVFEMRHYQGMRLRSIGEALGTTEEAAKNCLFRATQKMRAALGDFV